VAPAEKVEVKLSVDPAHKEELLPAVGALGIGLIVTLVVPGGPVHPLKVIVTEYVPLFDTVVAPMVGFCTVDVNPLGPVQLQVVPPLLVEVKLKVDPTHRGELLPTVGAEGVVMGTTATVKGTAAQAVA
jgi:hypothetical protein